MARRWLRGGFPRAYLSRSHRDCFEWLESFCRTFIERDLAQLGVRTPGTTLRRFWGMLAHRHGQVWNSSEFGRSFGVADTTMRRYLDILTDALVVRQLRPWHANLNKRQVKAPKAYLRDSGLVHHLLGISDAASLDMHPARGSTWEGLVLELVMEQLAATAVISTIGARTPARNSTCTPARETSGWVSKSNYRRPRRLRLPCVMLCAT